MKRRGFGHIVAFLLIVVVLILVLAAVANYYTERQSQNSYITGTFQGYSAVNKGQGDQYIVRISNATITCNSWSMSASDIYTLTHLESGQTVTMSLDCSDVAVG